MAGRSCLSVSAGMAAVDVRIDMTAALTVAVAEGCEPSVAPALLRAVQDGLAAARAKAQETKSDVGK